MQTGPGVSDDCHTYSLSECFELSHSLPYVDLVEIREVSPPKPALHSVVDATWNNLEWREQASCVDVETDLFFPVGFTPAAVSQEELARKICADCPVQTACLEFALRTHQDYGVWGGYNEEERRVIRRQRRAAARRLVPKAG